MIPSANLAETVARIRQQAVLMAGKHWSGLGNIIDSTLPDPLNPFILLPVATGIAVGGQIENLIPVASIIVLIDMALRIIDDCADEDSPYALYQTMGMGRAMNVAAALQSAATRELSNLDIPRVRLDALMARYFLSLSVIYEAQDEDMVALGTDLAQYQHIVQQKTIAAYEFTTLIGAYVSTTNPDFLNRCAKCGVHLGWMTQILNDIVGLWFPEGVSLTELKKRTFPIHLALSLDHPNAKILNNMYMQHNYDYDQIINLLDEMDIKTRLTHEALDHRDQALALLNHMPQSEGKAMIEHWLDWYLGDVMDMIRAS